MATRKRRYRVQRPAYRDGGKVDPPHDDHLPGFGMEEPEAHAATAEVPAPEAPPPPAHHPANADAVAQALAAQRLAEQMQAEAMQRAAMEQQPAQQQMSVAQWVAAQPWSDRRKQFVLQHPEVLLPQNAEAVEGYWKQARRLGITDEAEVDRYIFHGVQFERASREAAEERARNPHRQEPEDEPTHGRAPQSHREAVPPALAEPRRSMPMTAPVSREVPTSSGRRTSNKLHLTEDERRAAREAIPDRPDLPKLSNHEKELMYARNKAKYAEMRANGTYTDQRQR